MYELGGEASVKSMGTSIKILVCACRGYCSGLGLVTLTQDCGYLQRSQHPRSNSYPQLPSTPVPPPNCTYHDENENDVDAEILSKVHGVWLGLGLDWLPSTSRDAHGFPRCSSRHQSAYIKPKRTWHVNLIACPSLKDQKDAARRICSQATPMPRINITAQGPKGRIRSHIPCPSRKHEKRPSTKNP